MISCQVQPQSLGDYVRTIGDDRKVLNMLVGDTQRIWVYADQGFAIRQDMPRGVLAAFSRLVANGFTQRLLSAQSLGPP